MTFFRRFTFDLRYLRRPPWDSGIVPPEVDEFIREHPPGKALDLGCGTGTSSLALARAGWTVTGVDFVQRAIQIARQKARRAGLTIDFQMDDVLHLQLSPVSFSLILDIGCFHGLPRSGKTAYLQQLDRLLSTGATWLLYGFFKNNESPGPGLTPADLKSISLTLTKRQDGFDKKARPSAWFWFQKG